MSIGIRGYANSWSCIAGDDISISLATDEPLELPGLLPHFLEVRNAITNNLVYGPVPVFSIPVVPDLLVHADETGYGWEPVVTVPTDKKWDSVLYFAQVSTAGGVVIVNSRSFFVVRSATPGSPHRVLIHYPFATNCAYNGTFGNRTCLYDSDDHFRCRRVTTHKPNVLWDAIDTSGGIGLNYSAAFLQGWLATKAKRFHADACTSWDLHNDPAILNDYDLLILIGHDEYWSLKMRDCVESFVGRGGRVANFSGNSVWWQIRFSEDGGEMICYKSMFEDPLLGIDNRVTSNWSCAFTAGVENRLTGVSFRYGLQNGTAPLKIIPPDPEESLHPVFVGLKNKSGNPLEVFGSGLGGEADGLELDFSDPTRPVPTLRDGTPDTFKLLAYTDPVGNAPPGRGTMGYYTNVGAVFSCPFWNWADQMTVLDPDGVPQNNVEKITFKVIKWLLDLTPQGAMGPSLSEHPPADWTEVESGTFTALTGSMQGRIFATDGKALFWRHPDMTTGWEPVSFSIPVSDDIFVLGTDYYAYRLLAGVGNRLFLANAYQGMDGKPKLDPFSEITPPVGPTEVFAGITGPDHQGVVYAIVKTSDGRAELRARRKAGSWIHIGEATGLCSLDSIDGYLIASTTESRLVARMGGTLKAETNTLLTSDLTWFEFGNAPDVFALGHYFGRLYALSGGTGVSKVLWREAKPGRQYLPVNHGRLLFYNDKTGWCATGRFLGNGDYEESGNFLVGPSWTHVVPINNHLVLFYNSVKGTALVGKIEADATFVEIGRPSGFGHWDIVVSDGRHVVFCATGSFEGYVGFFNPSTGAYENTDYKENFSPTWKAATSTWGTATKNLEQSGRYFVFYAADGSVAIGQVDRFGKFHTVGQAKILSDADQIVAAGQLGIFAYDSLTGAAEFGEIVMNAPTAYRLISQWPASSFDTRWSLGSGKNGLVFFYHAVSGFAIAGGFSRNTEFQELNRWDAGSFLPKWSKIVGLDSSPGS